MLLLVMALGLSGCGSEQPLPATPTPVAATPAATAALSLQPPTATVPAPTSTITPSPEPTFTPSPTLTPTPTPWPQATFVPDQYVVDWGDTLQAIAGNYGITLEQLLEMNGMDGDRPLQVGQVLAVPSAISVNLPQAYLIHDSEVVYSHAYQNWDTRRFVEQQGGYLAQYREGELTGAEIIDQVAFKYHVGPRALLAVMELASGWVTNPAPSSLYPFGLRDPGRATLTLQAKWAAVRMMEGYYGQLEGRRDWVFLSNGVPARLYPGTNPGTAGIASVLALISEPLGVLDVMQSNAFQNTYLRLFGTVAGGAVLPPDGEQPYFGLPWREGEIWYFTGGPHGGWGDRESGWAALDFAPPLKRGCAPSRWPTLAVAPGMVIQYTPGETWVDMDGDGNIHTGWVVFYMHLSSTGHAPLGTFVEAGDPIGFASCEGGISTGAHLHLARMYNGQWMPAYRPVPFQLGEWTARGFTTESYDGYLRNEDGRVLEACDCRSRRKNQFPEVWHPGMR
ncbi:MAG TPA: LysM peptidoglycan-binding domain-containing protein [Ardenticatenaceae bacterium]